MQMILSSAPTNGANLQGLTKMGNPPLNRFEKKRPSTCMQILIPSSHITFSLLFISSPISCVRQALALACGSDFDFSSNRVPRRDVRIFTRFTVIFLLFRNLFPGSIGPCDRASIWLKSHLNRWSIEEVFFV